MQMTQKFIQMPPRHFAEPVIETGKQTEHRAQRQHIMEMRNHIIGIMQVIIQTAIGQNNTGHTANGEHENEAQRPHHRRFE